MKRTGFVIFILLSALGLGFTETEQLAMAGLPFNDSSLGKDATFLPLLTPEAASVGMTMGKLPYVYFREGPPPRRSGPGLHFNTKELFYVYTDRGASPNHYAPSGWMGDYEDLTLDTNSHDDPADGKTCIKITYKAPAEQAEGWAGMYWQQPINNWGDKKGGYNLKGMKRLTFWARGAKGGEIIDQFVVGGIQGHYADSDAVRIGPVELTTDWKRYVMDLSSADLSRIAGGFAWATSRDSNPDGLVFYLDEIRFER
jgi:hypothetical protein